MIYLKRFFPYILILLLLFLTYNYSYIFLNLDLDDYYGKFVNQDAYNFNLKSPDGKEVRLSDYQGQYVILTFGFTKCTGVCPLNLHRFKNLSYELLKLPGLDLKFIFISFDQIRDVPDEMNEFTSNFEVKSLIGLISGKDTGLEVAKKYKNHIHFDESEIKKDSNYQINHNGFLYLIDPNGKLSLLYMQQDLDHKKIIDDIKRLKKKMDNKV